MRSITSFPARNERGEVNCLSLASYHNARPLRASGIAMCTKEIVPVVDVLKIRDILSEM